VNKESREPRAIREQRANEERRVKREMLDLLDKMER
jgi:hypothetical protein